jgi:hypothetical protein
MGLINLSFAVDPRAGTLKALEGWFKLPVKILAPLV